MPHFVFDPAGRDRSVSAPRSGLSWSNQDGVAGPPTLNGTVGVAGGGTGATAAQAAWLRSRVSTFSALRRLDHPILAVRPRPHWRRSPSRRMRWGRMGSCVSPRSGAIRAAPEAGRQGSSSTERHSLSRPHLRTQAFRSPANADRNRNATNWQLGTALVQGNWGASPTAVVTSSHAATGALNITITGQLANAADTITLHAYTVELVVP